MSDISTRDAVLDLGSQIKNAFRSMSGKPVQGASPVTDVTKSVEQESPVSPEAIEPAPKPKTVEIKSLKKEIGLERTLVNETIQNKLSEYGLPPTTKLSIERGITGELLVKGPVVNSQLERIAFDLNQDQQFVAAYQSLTRQAPTLDYVTNVTKLTQAYGSSNQVFESIVSDDEQFNQLKDLTLRYQSLASQQV